MSPTVEDIQRVQSIQPEPLDVAAETNVCSVCGEERPRGLLMMTMHPIGEYFDLDPMALTRNVWHCGDRLGCVLAGEDIANWTADLVIGWDDVAELETRWESA